VEQRFRSALRAVADVAAVMLEPDTDRKRVAMALARSVTRVVPDTCLISLRSEDEQTITLTGVHDEDARVIEAYEPLTDVPRQLSPIAADALSRGTQFLPVLDLDMIERTGATASDSLAIMRALGMRSMILAPLRFKEALIGLMTVFRHDPARPIFDDVDRELIDHVATYAALALGNARLAAQKSQLAIEVEANRFVDAILQHIPDMVFVKDAAELRFVRMNHAGEALLGVPSTDLLGKYDYDFCPREEASLCSTKDRETLAGGTIVDIPEEPIQTAHGKRWLHTKKVPIADAAGTPRYLLGISEDITERKKAHAALQAAKDKAEAAARELEAFSYSVAHDLRAPLRGIDGFAQALLEDYGKTLDAGGHRHLERIRAAAQRMATLIDELLRLSRISRQEDRRERVDMSAIARISIAQLERAEPDRKIQIVIPDDVTVEADPKLLAIALDNLFGNAWKFTRRVASPRIELGVSLDGAEPVYFVRDNGAGFDMAYQNKLFGVFQRLHPESEFPGTGIGLATVKRIIERHGGRVWAESTLGSGATFYFTLPARGDRS
jgi:PAS domain S-box-containing protein